MPGPTSDHEIRGAFGTLNDHDAGERRGGRARLLALLAVIGPGLIVMVGDNDAGGVSTYAQAGQNFGYTLLWTLPLLIPVLIVNQEMVARLGVVTGVGHGRLIRERIGRRWGNRLDLVDPAAQLRSSSSPSSSESRSRCATSASRPSCSVPIAAVALFCDDRDRVVPTLGALHDALRRGQPRRDPADLARAPLQRAHRARSGRTRACAAARRRPGSCSSSRSSARPSRRGSSSSRRATSSTRRSRRAGSTTSAPTP